jgi:hypothetical protein
MEKTIKIITSLNLDFIFHNITSIFTANDLEYMKFSYINNVLYLTPLKKNFFLNEFVAKLYQKLDLFNIKVFSLNGKLVTKASNLVDIIFAYYKKRNTIPQVYPYYVQTIVNVPCYKNVETIWLS